MDNAHYRKHKIQTVHCAWEWDLTWAEFNAVKYIEISALSNSLKKGAILSPLFNSCYARLVALQ